MRAQSTSVQAQRETSPKMPGVRSGGLHDRPQQKAENPATPAFPVSQSAGSVGLRAWHSALPWLAAAGIPVIIAGLYPLFFLVRRAIYSPEGLTWTHLEWLVTQPQVQSALVNSLVTSGSATVLAVGLALPLAGLFIKTRLPGRWWMQLALLAPLVVPPHVLSLAWLQWAGPVGFLQTWIRRILGLHGVLWSLYGPGGIVLLLTIFSLPIAYLALAGGLVKIPRSVEEAAMCDGASTWQVWRYIIAPLMSPYATAAIILCFLGNLGNFGIPALLGIPAQYTTLPTLIYRQVTSFSGSAFGNAAALGLLLGLPSLLALAAQGQSGIRREVRLLDQVESATWQYSLGRSRWPLAFCLAVLIALVTLGPFFAMGATSLIRAYGLPLTWENLTLDHFRFVLFELARARIALKNSLLLAAGAAVICSAIGFVLGYAFARRRATGLHLIVSLPYALPGIVFSLALILAWINPPVPGLQLYGTLWLLLIAYVGCFLALALQPITAGWSQLSSAIEEAATVDGANFGQMLIYIFLPLLFPSLAVAAALVFMQAFVELTLSALLAGSGSETLGWLIFGLAQGGAIAHSAALSTVLLLMLAAVALIVGWIRLRGESHHTAN